MSTVSVFRSAFSTKRRSKVYADGKSQSQMVDDLFSAPTKARSLGRQVSKLAITRHYAQNPATSIKVVFTTLH